MAPTPEPEALDEQPDTGAALLLTDEQDQAIAQARLANADSLPGILVTAYDAVFALLGDVQAELTATVEQFTAELEISEESWKDRLAAEPAQERIRLAALFEANAGVFSEGLTVETLCFMLRLGS